MCCVRKGARSLSRKAGSSRSGRLALNPSPNHLLSGEADANIEFDDLVWLLRRLNFDWRIRGSHHIFWRQDFPGILNLQPRKDGKAKIFQVVQARDALLILLEDKEP